MFKVGDIVTGLPDNGYGVTTDKAIMEVVNVGVFSEDSISLRMLDYIDKDEEFLGTFYVKADGFVKFDPDNDEQVLELLNKGLKYHLLINHLNGYRVTWEDDHVNVGCHRISKTDFERMVTASQLVWS